MDQDKSGNVTQKARISLGPSIGGADVYVQPQITIITPGAYNVQPGVYVILVNVNAVVTINLPDVREWVKQTVILYPNTVLERALWIKDLGRHAALNNITVHPFSGQTIDTLSGDFTIIENGALMKLYPLNDLTGWFIG